MNIVVKVGSKANFIINDQYRIGGVINLSKRCGMSFGEKMVLA